MAATPSEGPRIEISDASVDVHGHVVATFTVTQDGASLGAAEVLALAPRFAVASLEAHPVDGQRAWRSHLLTGATLASVPLSAPEAPDAQFLTTTKQPGSETAVSLTDLGDGRLRYTFAAALTAFDPDATVRVGVWLSRATSPSLRTSATHDFRPSGGPVEERASVLDENCAGCHGAAVVHHDGRAGVRLCETCHTWQNADPDTIDPTALVTASTTTRTYPNSLELGRLVHRIHRGKELPTLYYASSRANPAPRLHVNDGTFSPDVDTTAIAARLPFSPDNNTTPIVGRKYSLIGYRSRELVAGRVVQRTDNGQAPRTVAEGIAFPRELRDCAACHDRAPQAYLAKTAISRRTCAGCHPDVWFQDTPLTLDEGHFAHSGGPQPDDRRCAFCHVEAPAGWRLYAPIELAHAPVDEGIRYGAMKLEILRVDGLRPGRAPRITFRVGDRSGPLVPSLADPVPLFEPAGAATSSFVSRSLRAPPRGSLNGGALTIRVAGPTAPEYGASTTFLTSGSSGNPDPLALATTAGTDEYVYTFTSVLPAGAAGTWAVAIEARRRLKYGLYDAAADAFRWPYTGERVTESPDNVVVYVDVATGAYVANAARATARAVPRRTVVSQQKCDRCHGRIELHGRTRHQVELCLFCHSPTGTDYGGRKKVGGLVDLNQSYDGIEERSIHFKVLIHRIHTGAHAGSASLEAIAPFMVGSTFYDDVRYPNDLADCTACHEGRSYLVDAVPSDAPPTVANETATVRHAPSDSTHPASDPRTLPISAACLGCHATGATQAHVALNTAGTVERCVQCHAKGALGVEVAHGLATLDATTTARFSSLVEQIFVPRCATTACHGEGANAPRLDAAGAYLGLLGAGGAGAPSSSPLPMVTPSEPDRSYLVHKLRGDAASVGGSVTTIMPPDGALSASDVAAVEAWISNGAPND